jgi:FkbM family methyltransferase
MVAKDSPLHQFASRLRRRLSYRRYLATRLPAAVQNHTSISELLARTPEGTFEFDVRDEGVGWRIALEGGWEPAETAFVKQLVAAGDLVVDVGANIGWYSVVFARLVGERGSVIAFEPHPRNYELLTNNIRRNGVDERVTVHQLALMDSDGAIAFELSPSNFGDHRIRFGGLPRSEESEQYEESRRSVISVSGTTLDNALRSSAARADIRKIKLLKVDCQGSEIAILRGAATALSHAECLVSEYWPYGLRRAGHDPEEFLQIVANNFSRFARVRGTTEANRFEPVSMLPDDARRIQGAMDYAFLK